MVHIVTCNTICMSLYVLLIIISVWTKKLLLNRKQINHSAVFVARELLYLSITLSRILNSCSNATVE
ncbi:hypothetical protein QVD17_05182 [Tagetes erecta]|uniref:Uncharacterized protein n=1 Tax=Tagetes erecta TaxID=13708 RepID=A0AAD8P572_TARER|nr:hypothetical protein QVD17_05182 [Tagetes erecta]